MKSPAEVADQVLQNHVIRPDWRRTGEQIRELLIEAVELDRRVKTWPADPSALELTSAEGLQYAPKLQWETDQDGQVRRLEVGIAVTTPVVDEDGNHETHELRFVPSTDTGEGTGTGNVFVYLDDDAVTHFAWGETEEGDPE